jgi:putative transposase
MSYSLDLRRKVIQFIENGGGIRNAARVFNIGRATIYRWLERPDLAPTKVKSRKGKIDITALEKDVQAYPDTPLKDRAKKFGVRPSALCYRFKKMAITRKKTTSLSRKKPQRAD